MSADAPRAATLTPDGIEDLMDQIGIEGWQPSDLIREAYERGQAQFRPQAVRLGELLNARCDEVAKLNSRVEALTTATSTLAEKLRGQCENAMTPCRDRCVTYRCGYCAIADDLDAALAAGEKA